LCGHDRIPDAENFIKKRGSFSSQCWRLKVPDQVAPPVQPFLAPLPDRLYHNLAEKQETVFPGEEEYTPESSNNQSLWRAMHP
jgi:hypothetical protein